MNLSDADAFMSGDEKIFASGLSTEMQALLLLSKLLLEDISVVRTGMAMAMAIMMC